MDNLNVEKQELIEDYEGCKKECDKNIQGVINDIKKKKLQLNDLKERVIQCKCKLPIDVAVTVKRTPSLAAACTCKSAADAKMDSCSCTSLRTRLLLNLFADLFGGLTQELGDTGSNMPCQMLKCLDDKHNWEKATLLKTNLDKYFQDLLLGELDIAIQNSIENYHAKWVSASCVDQFPSKLKKKRSTCSGESDAHAQQKKMEERAKTLATKLGQQIALQLFSENSPNSESPTCECSHSPPPNIVGNDSAAFHFQVDNNLLPLFKTEKQLAKTATSRNNNIVNTVYVSTHKTSETFVNNTKKDLGKDTGTTDLRFGETCEKVSKTSRGTLTKNSTLTTVWKKTQENVLLLRTEISDLKKVAVNKSDLKSMEKNLLKYIQPKNSEKSNLEKKHIQAALPIHKKSVEYKKSRDLEIWVPPTEIKRKIFKRNENMFTVNVCLCEPLSSSKNIQPGKLSEHNAIKQKNWSRKTLSTKSSFKQTKPIRTSFFSNNSKMSKFSSRKLCESNRACFHKIPSTTSIDNLLKTLEEWNCNQVVNNSKIIKTAENSLLKYSKNVLNDSFMSSINGNKQACDTNGLHNVIESIQQAQQQNSKSDSISIGENNLVGNHNCSQITQGLISGIHSEYIAAVNLDKSNEQIYKHNHIHDNSKHNNDSFQPEDNCKLYDSIMCHKKKSEVFTRTFTKAQDTVLEVKNVINTPININGIGSVLSTKDQTTDTARLLINPIYDYHIKFLGVTLDDIGAFKNNLLNHSEDNYSPASVVLEDDNNPRENISSGDMIIKKTESCVCCSINKNINSFTKDLEKNAFDLLQSHLKRKVTDFKNESSDSYILTPLEEQNIYDTIIKKVKDFITDNINNTPCTCPYNENNKVSWKRVHYLLQEYLKTKISRLQCQCGIENQCHESVVPKLLNKISEMIDNDFKKLSDLCKKQIAIIDTQTDQSEFISHLSEKEINTDNLGDSKCLNVKQNISLQVQPCLRTITISCDTKECGSLVSKSTEIEHISIVNTTTSCTAIGEKDKTCDCLGILEQNVKMLEKNKVLVSCVHELNSDSAVFTPSIHFRQVKVIGNSNKTDGFNCPLHFKENLVINTDDSTMTHADKTVNYSAENTDLRVLDSLKNSSPLTENVCNDFLLNRLNTHFKSYLVNSGENILPINHDTTIGPNEVNRHNSESQKSQTYSTDVITEGDEEYVLKKYNCFHNKISHKTNTYKKDSVKFLNTSKSLNTFNEKKQNYKDSSLEQCSSEENLDYLSDPELENCNCDLVPICHVKLLVEGIEKNLLNSNCTCDSMSREVCPVHSTQNYA